MDKSETLLKELQLKVSCSDGHSSEADVLFQEQFSTVLETGRLVAYSID